MTMMTTAAVLAAAVLLAAVVVRAEDEVEVVEVEGVGAVGDEEDPSYDHQEQTYTASFQPVTVTSPDDLTVMPFTSPETSSSTLVDLINSATSTIDLATPGFSSWSGCTPYSDDTPHCVTACTPSKQQGELFPIFPALLNAVHERGVKIRILTNNFNTPDCGSTISPLPYLALNGVSVRYYSTTTFMHAKYMMIDGKKVSISSINYSRTSFTRNREVGCVLGGSDASPLLSMTKQVFENDFDQGSPLAPTPKAWNSTELSIITSTASLPVVLPKPSSTQEKYYSPSKPQPIGVQGEGSAVTVWASPDYAQAMLLDSVNAAKSSLDVMIYQITSPVLVDRLIALHSKGVTLRLLVSSAIYGSDDCASANTMYAKLVSAGISVHKTTRHYTYSHQKFWIVDGVQVGWSTGNWSPSDYPDSTASKTTAAQFPPHGQDGWAKTNRDYNVLVSSPSVVKVFQEIFEGDLDEESSFPSPVYPWETRYPVACGR